MDANVHLIWETLAMVISPLFIKNLDIPTSSTKKRLPCAYGRISKWPLRHIPAWPHPLVEKSKCWAQEAAFVFLLDGIATFRPVSPIISRKLNI